MAHTLSRLRFRRPWHLHAAENSIGSDGLAAIGQYCLVSNHTDCSASDKPQEQQRRNGNKIPEGQLLSVSSSNKPQQQQQQRQQLLSSLDVSLNQIRGEEESFRTFTRTLQANTTLERLWFNRNHLGPQGGIALAEALRHSTALKSLSLNGTHIQDEGFLALLDTIFGPRRQGATLALEYLNVGDCGITSTGCQALAKCLAKDSYQEDVTATATTATAGTTSAGEKDQWRSHRLLAMGLNGNAFDELSQWSLLQSIRTIKVYNANLCQLHISPKLLTHQDTQIWNNCLVRNKGLLHVRKLLCCAPALFPWALAKLLEQQEDNEEKNGLYQKSRRQQRRRQDPHVDRDLAMYMIQNGTEYFHHVQY